MFQQGYSVSIFWDPSFTLRYLRGTTTPARYSFCNVIWRFSFAVLESCTKAANNFSSFIHSLKSFSSCWIPHQILFWSIRYPLWSRLWLFLNLHTYHRCHFVLLRLQNYLAHPANLHLTWEHRIFPTRCSKYMSSSIVFCLQKCLPVAFCSVLLTSSSSFPVDDLTYLNVPVNAFLEMQHCTHYSQKNRCRLFQTLFSHQQYIQNAFTEIWMINIASYVHSILYNHNVDERTMIWQTTCTILSIILYNVAHKILS